MWGNRDFLLVEAGGGEGSGGERQAASTPTPRPGGPRPERPCTSGQVSADACAVVQSTARLRDTSQVPRGMPDAPEMLCSSHMSSVPRRARDTRRVSASALPVHPHPARSLVAQIQALSTIPQPPRAGDASLSLPRSAPGTCEDVCFPPRLPRLLLWYMFTSTAPGRVAQHTYRA